MKVLKKTDICSFFILITIVFVGFFTNFVDAQDSSGVKTLYLNDKQLKNETLFINEKLMTPESKLIKDFYIKNNNDFKCTIKNFIIDGELRDKAGNVIDKGKPQFNNFMDNSLITVFYNGKEISKQKLYDTMTLNFTEDNQISLEKDETKKVTIEYAFEGDADNSIQDVEYKFNIDINYSSIDSSETSGVLIQTGTFFDNKVVTILGIGCIVIGSIIIFTKNNLNEKEDD